MAGMPSVDDTQAVPTPAKPASVEAGAFSGTKGVAGVTATSPMEPVSEPTVSTPPSPVEMPSAPKVSGVASSMSAPDLSVPKTGMGEASTSPLGGMTEPEDTSAPSSSMQSPAEEDEGTGTTGGSTGGTGSVGM